MPITLTLQSFGAPAIGKVALIVPYTGMGIVISFACVLAETGSDPHGGIRASSIANPVRTRWRDGRRDLTSFFTSKSFDGRTRMDALPGVIGVVGHAIEALMSYVERHHWIFGFLGLGYVFYVQDRALHARFDALEKRVDEIRKRLTIEY